jgi:hypothetical protein
MPDREPEPWEGGAAGSFLWIEGSPVEARELGGDRFALRASGQEQIFTAWRRLSGRRTPWLSGLAWAGLWGASTTGVGWESPRRG